MNANEAPEKIFLEREKETNKIHHLWGRTPVVSSFYEHIEYTRTDVLIKKACEYLQNTKRCVVECIGENVYKPLLSEEEIMEFCKSMKGE